MRVVLVVLEPADGEVDIHGVDGVEPLDQLVDRLELLGRELIGVVRVVGLVLQFPHQQSGVVATVQDNLLEPLEVLPDTVGD